LLYQTELVPVGEDQLQHIELARELARRFNTRFGETFVLPQGRVPKMGARIMALDNPEKKMSKSATSALGYIAMTDEPALIIKKIQRAETDSGTDIVMSQDKPAISNLLAIYHLLSGESVKDLEKKYRDVGYGVFKKDLADVVVAHLSPIREKYREFLDDRHELEKILRKGSERAEGIAAETLRTAKERVGLGL
jgi:tryptophanyl-tRNA synthetase